MPGVLFCRGLLIASAILSLADVADATSCGSCIQGSSDPSGCQFNSDCISKDQNSTETNYVNNSPISKIIGPIEKIQWKQVYKGFSEFITNIDGDDNELKLIKM